MLVSYFQCTFDVYFPFFQICLLPLFETSQGLQSWNYPWTIAISALFWRVSYNNVMSFSKAVFVLSSAKSYNEDFFIKPIRSFINILNSNDPRIDPWETPESSVWIYFVCYLH